MTGLINNNCCPACGSARFSPAGIPALHSVYSRGVVALLTHEDAKRFEATGVNRCEDCDSLFPDLWLSEETSGMLYSIVEGQHLSGWTRLTWSLTHQDRAGMRVAARRNQDRIAAHLPKLERYAEVKCPFSGMLPFLDQPELSDGLPGLQALIDTSLKRTHRVPLDRSQPLEGLAAFAPLREIPSMDLIDITSPICWSDNCTISGMGCRTLARAMFGLRVLSVDDLRERGLHYDLIGLYLVLDHLPRPREVLRRLMASTDALVIQTHITTEWHSQHAYTLGERFFHGYEDLGFETVEITDEMENFTTSDTEPDCRYFLLRRQV